MKKVLLSLAFLLGAITAFAQEMNAESTVTGTMPAETTMADQYQKLHVGFLSGINAPAGTTVNNSAEWGGEIGYQPTNLIGVGLEATTTKLDRVDKAQRTMAFFKGTARMGGEVPFLQDVYVGGVGGPVISKSKVRIGGGPLAGFDVPLSARANDYFSLGLNAKYVFTKDTPDALISALALKYWF